MILRGEEVNNLKFDLESIFQGYLKINFEILYEIPFNNIHYKSFSLHILVVHLESFPKH